MGTYKTWDEPANCPRCGGPSVCTRYSDHPEWPRHPQHCAACAAEVGRRSAMFRVDIRQRFPMLSERTVMVLMRNFSDLGLGGLLALSDADLLAGRNVGRKMLAEFRAAWPVPIPETPPAQPCMASHGSLSWVGG